MPLDINKYDVDKLVDFLNTLKPGQALVTNDGLTVRRRYNFSGFDCNVGPGGHGMRGANTAEDAATYTLMRSAQSTNPMSLGGDKSHKTIEDALHAVANVDNSVVSIHEQEDALAQYIGNARISSYRVRAERARKALHEGDVATAVKHIKVIIEHAGQHGAIEEVERAQGTLNELRKHPFTPDKPQIEGLEVRPRNGGHVVFWSGRPMTTPMSREDADRRKEYFARKIERDKHMSAIDKEVRDGAVVVRERVVEEKRYD